MPEFRVENHLPHKTNTVHWPYFADFAPQSWPERTHVPRAAEETVAVIGLARVMGIDLPILQRRFTCLIHDEDMPYDPHIFNIVSYETIAAAQRSGRPIDDLGYPMGIVRDSRGFVLGCKAFGMPQPFEPIGVPELSIRPEDVARLGDPEAWVNTANYPTNLYDPASVPSDSDMIDPYQHDPILAMEIPAAPLDVSPSITIDESRSERFGVPIVKVSPNQGSDGIKNLPANRESLHILHPTAFRHATLLGESVRLCGVAGGLVRDRYRGTVLGGTAIYVPDPAMIARDGM